MPTARGAHLGVYDSIQTRPQAAGRPASQGDWLTCAAAHCRLTCAGVTIGEHAVDGERAGLASVVAVPVAGARYLDQGVLPDRRQERVAGI